MENYFYSLFRDYCELKYNRVLVEDESFKTEDTFIEVLEEIVQEEPCEYIRIEFKKHKEHGLAGQKGFQYLCLLRGVIRQKKEEPTSRRSGLNSILPMIYKPSMNFKRGTNQSGLFLYQNYMSSEGNLVLEKQNVKPDHVIVVTNKKGILQELDSMNINRKYVYGDHSNIAQYIEEQHEFKRDIMKKMAKDD